MIAALDRDLHLLQFKNAKLVAQALRARYEPTRAITLIGRLMLKALFAAQAEDVLFWALVHAHYRGGDRAQTQPDFVDRIFSKLDEAS